MLDFGLFGTGHWAAEVHAAALAAHPAARLAGVWGRDPAKAAALAQRYGVPAFEEIDALIDAVDAVAVALPPDVQAEIATRAATAGRHLLLDKPLALRVSDADRVVAAASQAGVASEIFFTSRFDRENAAFLAATAAAGGWHTAQVSVFGSIFQPGNPFGGSPWRREHGGLWDVGPHALSVVLPVLGPVTRVAALDGSRGTTNVLLGHESGASSTLSLTLDAPPAATAWQATFFGEQGIASMPNRSGSAVEAFQLAVDQLVGQVESGDRDGRCDVRFGREVVAVLAAAEAARAEGRTVIPG